MSTLLKRQYAVSGRSLPYFSLLLVGLLLGTTFSVTKGALDTLPPLGFVGWRFAAATLGLVLLGIPRGCAIWKDGFVAGMILYVAVALQTAGLASTTASKSALITALYVLIVPMIGGAAARRTPQSVVTASALLAVAGLAMLTFETPVFGDALTIGAAIAYAGHQTIVRQSPHPIVPYTTAQVAVVSGLGLLTSAMFEGFSVPEKADLPAIVFVGLVVSAGAFLLYTWSQTKLPGGHGYVVPILEPLFAVPIAIAVHNESLSSRAWFGAALLIGAVIAIAARSRPGLAAGLGFAD